MTYQLTDAGALKTREHIQEIGSVRTAAAPQACNHESDATYDYYAFAAAGTSTATPVWQVCRILKSDTTTTTWADGDGRFDNVGSSLAGLTYA